MLASECGVWRVRVRVGVGVVGVGVGVLPRACMPVCLPGCVGKRAGGGEI